MQRRSSAAAYPLAIRLTTENGKSEDLRLTVGGRMPHNRHAHLFIVTTLELH